LPDRNLHEPAKSNRLLRNWCSQAVKRRLLRLKTGCPHVLASDAEDAFRSSQWRFLIYLLFRRRIGVELEPHRIEDGEAAGEAYAEDPAEIPHGNVLL
jgi:hypothetical protein